MAPTKATTQGSRDSAPTVIRGLLGDFESARADAARRGLP
jgi:hypothetical protein